MAQPAPIYDRDKKKAVTRPDLQALEGGGETSPPTGNLSAAPEPADLAKKEEAPTDPYRVGRGYTGTSNQKARKWLFNKRRKALGGGLLGTIIAILLFFTFASGPLQFIHIAQLMQQFHFSANEDAADGRFFKTIRFIRSKDIKDTRMGVLGTRYAKNIEARLEKAGIKPMYTDKFSYFDGFTVDPDHSSNKGKSRQQIIREWETKGVVLKESGQVKGLSAQQRAAVGNHLVASMAEQKPGLLAERRLINGMLSTINQNKIVSVINFRNFAKFSGSTLHPIKRLDRKINQSAADAYNSWRENRKQRLKTGVGAIEFDTRETPADSDDETEKNHQSEQSKEAKSAIDKLKNSKGVKISGGFAAAVGIGCALKAIDDNAAAIKQVQVVLPLIRMGTEIVSLGNQVMSGQDIDLEQLGFYAKQLNGTDSRGKKSSWSAARSIQAELGQPQSGVEANDTLKTITKGSPFSFINGITGINQVCSKVGQFAAGAVSLTLGILSGGTFQTVSYAVVGFLAGPVIIDQAADWAAGEAINVDMIGADYGNAINYGARLAANGQAVTNGGVALTENDELALKNFRSLADKADFQGHGLIYKLLNPYDSHTTASQFIDKLSINPLSNMQSFASGLFNIGNLGKIPPLFSPKVQAATTYSYGFDKYGFSLKDLNDPAFNNPFENATKAAGILSGEKREEYIARAKNCFGVEITQNPSTDGQAVWDAQVSGTPEDIYDAEQYKKYNCNDRTQDWLRIRFFIFDTQTMKAAACYEGDTAVCSELGFDSGEVPDSHPETPGINELISPPNLGPQIGRTGYYRMPDATKGEYVFNGGTPTNERCGSKALVDAVYTVAAAWNNLYPNNKLAIGDLNADGHASHLNGVDVDIYGSDGSVANTSGDRQKSIALGRLWADTGIVSLIFYNDSAVQSDFNNYVNDRGLSGNMQYWPGHEDHFHVRILDKYGLATSAGCPG